MRQKWPVRIKKGLSHKHFHVTIFGSSRIERNDKYYMEVYNLAKMIGVRGIDVVTGGGPGIMEAANSGHQAGSEKNDSHSIGLGISLPHEQSFNKSVKLYKKFDKFSNRLDDFMLLSNVVVVAPGGVGTMLELFYTWQLVQVRKMDHIPIILMGDMWKGLLKWLRKQPLKRKFFDKDDLKLISIAKDHKQAIKLIEKAYGHHKKVHGQ